MHPYLLLRPAKTEEAQATAQVGLLSSLLSIGKPKWYDSMLFREPKTLSFEIASIDQKTRFYLHAPTVLTGYFASQVASQYPKTLIEDVKDDPLLLVMKGKYVAVGKLELVHGSEYPIKTQKLAGESQLVALLGFLNKLSPEETAFVQILVKTPRSQDSAQKKIRDTIKPSDAKEANPYGALITEKLSSSLLDVQIRIVFASTDKNTAKARLSELMGTFGVYTRSEGNALVPSIVEGFGKKRFVHYIARREFLPFDKTAKLNLDEAASLWHLPDAKLTTIKGIMWGKTYISEAPDNLPIADKFKLQITNDKSNSNDQIQEVNFFARTEWRNRETIFGIKRDDRRKHMYIIGKTGTGKSTLIGNMAINDIRNGEGVAVIDPHGDLCEMILDYIPKRRINDVVYLDPTLSKDRAFTLNLFDQTASEHTDVVASGIISVFYKLYSNSWGPRLEYMLRNTILTLLMYEDATFADIPRLLTNKKFRHQVVSKIGEKEETLSRFWIDEYDAMTDRLRVESISSILNKVGQFLASERIRNIVDSKKSTFSLEDVMNNKKILLLNLSQGKLGEDTTALLGAMFITKIQLTAMQRVNIPEKERTDFYMYVDEFQNFATNSFIKILSEARKYKLNLTLANQYIGQVEEDVQKAIFGNVGSLLTFLVGSRDAGLFEKEFGSKFSADDLVSLGNYEVILKMAIDGLTSDPFMAKTLPPPSVINANKEKILKRCEEVYYRKI